MPSEVCLRGETGQPDCVTVDAVHMGRVMRCEGTAAGTRIEGVTFRRGQSDTGGGIYAVDSQVELLDCSFSQNEAGEGGGIFRDRGSSLALTGCTFSSNPVDATMTFTDCLFLENEAENVGGLYGNFSVGYSLTNCVFRANRSTAWDGGALKLSAVVACTLKACTFEGNSSVLDGGAVLAISGSLGVFEECGFFLNTAGNGGAIALRYSSPRVIGCTIAGCRATAGLGGGIFCRYSSSPKIRNCTLVSDTAATFGSGILADDASFPLIENSIIAFGTGNDAVACTRAGSVTIRCSDVFGNGGEDWVGCIAPQFGTEGNFSADPAFCHRGAGDFTLAAHSPCLPGKHPHGEDCGLIGAWDRACEDPTAVSPVTWGLLKGRFDPLSHQRRSGAAR